jgi:hypothetical protein
MSRVRRQIQNAPHYFSEIGQPKFDHPKSDNLMIGQASISPQNSAVTIPRFRGKLTLLNSKSRGNLLDCSVWGPPFSMVFKDAHEGNSRFDTSESLEGLYFACQKMAKTINVARICLGEFHFCGFAPLMLTRLTFPEPSQTYIPNCTHRFIPVQRPRRGG